MMDDRQAACNGCTLCAMRCTDGIRISEFEYERIVEELRTQDLKRVHKVLQQAKERPWFEDVTYTACLFLDLDSELCLIYPARPLICRLFGHVPHLPCPAERVPSDMDAARVLEAYMSQPLQTFQEWMAGDGAFSFDAILGEDYTPERYEL